MFPYQNSFSSIYLAVSNSLFRKEGYIPHFLNFQAFDFERRSKYEVMVSFMMNQQYTMVDKEQFMMIFQKAQVICSMFRKFIGNYRLKRAVEFDNQFDLSLEPMYYFSNKQKFVMLHTKTKYTFTVKELLKIIQDSLLSHDNFFPDPKIPKNPYNNLPFTNTNLLNFYFYLREQNIRIPDFFERFFRTQFILPRFLRENELFIRHNAIKNYHKGLMQDDLYEETILLLRSFKLVNLIIHIDFPRQEVIDKVLPILQSFWHSEYEMTTRSRTFYRSKMMVDLDKFLKNNINFGRLYLSKTGKKYPHSHFKITNVLSRRIPDYNNLRSVIYYMEHGYQNARVRDFFTRDEESEQDTEDEESGGESEVILFQEDSQSDETDGEIIEEDYDHEIDDLLEDMINHG
jgi:hypothetical protein